MLTNNNSDCVDTGLNKYKLNRNSIIESLIDVVNNKDCMLYFRNNSRRESQYSYKDVWTGALAFAEAGIKSGIKKGEKVVIILATCPEFLFSFYGVLLAGGVPVPVAPPSFGLRDLSYYTNRLNAVLDNSSAKHIATFEADIETFNDKIKLKGNAYNFINVNTIDFCKDTSIDYYLPKSDDLCFIQYTSGSTSAPKGVPLTHGNILANIEGIGKSIRISEDDRGISWMPLYHDMGLIGGMIMHMHYALKRMVFMSPMLMARPIYWLKYITEYKSTIGPGNNFAFSSCIKKIKDEELQTLDLSTWRIAFNGSEPIDVTILEQFYERFKTVGYRKNTMIPCYGLAEATLGTTFHSPDEEPLILECHNNNLYQGAKIELYDKTKHGLKTPIKLVSLGKPIDCLEVKIFDTEGKELPEGYIGRICIKGDSVMQGYWSGTNFSKDAFENGWLNTGDIGFVYEKNLYFTGREKEMVVIRGKNYSATDIECLVKEIDGVKANCVAFGFQNVAEMRESLGIVVETDEKDAEKIENMKNQIQKALVINLEIRADRIVITDLKTIPKTFNGKIRRVECINMFGK